MELYFKMPRKKYFNLLHMVQYVSHEKDEHIYTIYKKNSDETVDISADTALEAIEKSGINQNDIVKIRSNKKYGVTLFDKTFPIPKNNAEEETASKETSQVTENKENNIEEAKPDTPTAEDTSQIPTEKNTEEVKTSN